MKNNWLSTFSLILFIGLAATLTSCDKDTPEDSTVNSISDDEILEIVTGATAATSEGVTAEAVEMAYIADAVLEKGPTALECGETADSAFVRSINLDRITGSYTNYLYWGLECNDVDLPESIFFGREMSGSYETARLLSDDSASSDWSMSNLLLGPNYVFNGSYERTGTQESKVREMRSFSTSTVIEITDLNIDKGEKQIVSGLASFTITGSVNDEVSFNHTGNIVFLGDGIANIIINGNTYTIDLF